MMTPEQQAFADEMTRRVDVKAILKDPVKRRDLMVEALIATQAIAGIETTREQAEAAYDKVRAERKHVVFLHGLESGPNGPKFQALSVFPRVSAPDTEGVLDVHTRVQRVIHHLEAKGTPAILVGSSLGGLVALLVSTARPDLVAGLVLCAPALHRPETQAVGTLSCPAIIIHGENDEVVPLETVHKEADRLQISVCVVDDGHQLQSSIPEILEAVRGVWEVC